MNSQPSKFALQKGCFFQRVNPDAIKVWRRKQCWSCGNAISLGMSTVSCTDDMEPLRAGLLRVVEGNPPPEGLRFITGEKPYCPNCVAVWQDPANRKNGNLVEPFRE